MTDLQRSFQQYKLHSELGYMKLNLIKKFFLLNFFIMIAPLSLLVNLFLKRYKNNNEVYVIKYKVNREPYNTIYQELKKCKKFKFFSPRTFFIPIVPSIFFKDIINNFTFAFKNIFFISALFIKISNLYFYKKKYNITNMIVFQEYSFYISYLTRIFEEEGGKLYNIMHGVPGETYSFFRFSKCFVWGEYYKNKFIKDYKCEVKQFVISGSIFHNYLRELRLVNNKKNIDILYVIDGKTPWNTEVLEALNKISSVYNIFVKQHPLYKIDIKFDLNETDDNIIELLLRSRVIVSHYSTALLDAIVLNDAVISYIGKQAKELKYIDYLDKKNIVFNEDAFLKTVNKILSKNEKIEFFLEKKYIDFDKSPIKVITNEVF